MRKRGVAFACFVFLLAACGPSIVKQIRMKFDDDGDLLKQTKEGVTIENVQFKQFPPPALAMPLQSCSSLTGELEKTFMGSPVMENVSPAVSGQLWYRLAVSNATDHVLRFERTVMKMKDPKGGLYDPLNAATILSAAVRRRPCSTTPQLQPLVSSLKLLDSGAQLLPKTREEFWLVFEPATIFLPGKWNLEIFDVPVKVDQAGAVVKTTRFSFPTNAEKFQDTIQRNLDGTQKLLSSETAQ